MAPRVFTIGKAAARAGVTPDTIRYYERQGVLPQAPRTAAGYRVYSQQSVQRIQLAKNAVRFGFAVKELAAFLQACDAGHPPCHGVRNAGRRLLEALEHRLEELTAVRDEMRAALADWDRRLDTTPSGRPARLLHTLSSSAARPHPARR